MHMAHGMTLDDLRPMGTASRSQHAGYAPQVRRFSELITNALTATTAKPLLCGRGFQPREPDRKLDVTTAKALKIMANKIIVPLLRNTKILCT